MLTVVSVQNVIVRADHVCDGIDADGLLFEELLEEDCPLTSFRRRHELDWSHEELQLSLGEVTAALRKTLGLGFLSGAG